MGNLLNQLTFWGVASKNENNRMFCLRKNLERNKSNNARSYLFRQRYNLRSLGKQCIEKSKKIPTATMRKSNQHQAFVKNFTNP